MARNRRSLQPSGHSSNPNMCGREVVYEYPYLRFDRELEVFRLLGQGRTTSEIADELHLNLKTVQAYCARAKELAS